MQNYLVVMSTDAINRNGIKITPGAHAAGLWDEWEEGLPQLVSHDHERIEGWSRPFALLHEPGMTRLLGLVERAETEREVKEMRQRYQEKKRSWVQEKCKPYEEELKSKIGGSASDAELHYTDAACVVKEGLASQTFPGVFSDSDKDGLVRANELEHLGRGAFRINELLIFAHPYFRRSFSRLNSINNAFFQTVDRLINNSIEVRIALDPDLVGLAETYSVSEELDYWWGPHFSDDLTQIETGTTKHGNSNRDKYFSGIDHTDFFWYVRDGNRTLEVEEIRDIPSPAIDDRFGCRYVHSIVDDSSGVVDHLDGAVRIYSTEKMIERLDVNLNQAEKRTDYNKIWRIDSPLEISTWKQVINDFFRDNHLVGEYLGADREEHSGVDGARATTDPEVEGYASLNAITDSSTDTESSVTEDSVIRELVPYSIPENGGVRTSVSLHPLPEPPQCARWMSPVMFIPSSEDESTLKPALDNFVIDVVKIAEQDGLRMEMPDDIIWVSNNDTYLNIPPISHSELDRDVLSSSIDAIKELVSWSSSHGHNRVISFTVCYPLSDRELRVSVVGPDVDLSKWFEEIDPVLPTTRSELRTWADLHAEMQPQRLGGPDPFDLLTPPGHLFCERVRIPSFMNPSTSWDTTCDAFKTKIKFEAPRKYEDFLEILTSLVDKNAITPTASFVCEKIICSRCGERYTNCNCSLLRGESYREIREAKLLYHFWTDRPV